MRIHILGICGTFMGGLAQILKESGHSISGSDNQFYPPMSGHLENLDVEMIKGYSSKSMPDADLYIIGNALSRGNECVEYILDNQLPFRSGPEMLGEILKNRKVLAISGTHGKTTTSYMLAHIFLNQGRDIGFLVGGVSDDIKGSASLGTDNIFVIEADEYDSAFFDKRSKFIHYSPSTLVINNIEFDHADIFDHLDDIKRQFHHLIKIIPSSGEVIYFSDDKNSEDVISKGLWCKSTVINDNEIKISFEEQELEYKGIAYSLAGLPLIGLHNFKNYIAAILAAKTDDIAINDSIESLKSFNGVKRRLEYKGKFSNIHLYDDFAHHPTAIMFSSQAIRMKYPEKKILGLIELGSNTMSGGSHGLELLDTVACLDNAVWLDHKNVLSDGNNITSSDNIEDFINQTKLILSEYDIILLMTNKDSHKILKPLISYLEKNNIPVFPLGLVALPGSIQSLQIFEPRYVDMIKTCMSEQHGFVIVLQTKSETSSDFGMHKKGSYVQIIDFNNLPNGLLGITVKSENKVSISNIHQLEDGLHVADAKSEFDPEVDDQAVLAEYPDILNILSQLMKHPRVSDLPINVDFNSADSVAYHLAGLIPLTSSEKQNLLEAFDAPHRMTILSKYIEKLSAN